MFNLGKSSKVEGNAVNAFSVMELCMGEVKQKGSIFSSPVKAKFLIVAH